MALSAEPVRYHAEYHSKINSITLSIQVPFSGLTCTIGPEAIDLIPSNHPGAHYENATGEESRIEKIILPAVVMSTRTTLDPSSAQSTLLTLKLAVLPGSQSSPSSLTALSGTEFPPPPLPASQLQGLESVDCGCCGATLLKSDSGDQSQYLGPVAGPIQRVVDLPSEHWQELVDCWMCHEEDFTELREGDLGARLGHALVGGTYVLIHASNVDHAAVIIEEDARIIDWSKGIKRRWRPLACSRCLHPVGDGWFQSRLEDGTDLEMIQVKFHKYMVQFKGQDKSKESPLSIPRQRFASYVAAEIFESARHHATYRFILQERFEGRDMIMMWMLNWDSTIITNQEPVRDDKILWDASLQSDLSSSNSTSGPARSRKVIKVLYLGALSPEEEEAARKMEEGAHSKELRLWDQWRGDPGVEKLQFHESLVLGLLTTLEQSSSCLPPSLNGAASAVLAMDGMRIGSIEI